MKYIYRITKRNAPYLLLDLFIINLAYALAYVLRFYPDLGSETPLVSAGYFILLSGAYIFSFYGFQTYRTMWQYSNIRDVYKLGAANFFGFLIFVLVVLFFHLEYSRLVYIMYFFFTLAATIFYRVLIRDYFSKRRNGENGKSEKAVFNRGSSRHILLVGAGETGRTILAEYAKLGMEKNVVGFLDDDREKKGKILGGKTVLAVTDEITDVIKKHDIDEVIITVPQAGSESINRVALRIRTEFKKEKNVRIRVLPSLLEALDKRSLVGSLREIGIDDLIGREEVKVDDRAIEKTFSNKTVLITGAGGSIGAEICRQLLKFRIKRLVAVGRGEYSIYELIKNLHEYRSYLDYETDIVFKIADIKDPSLIRAIFGEYRPDVVFHAAAHKHVPLMEFNEAEAVQNNIVGTINLLELSNEHEVEKFVLISTDKAVNPVSVMGATKRVAELFSLYYFREKGVNTSIVRFGNVIGSRGSVIPLFKEQIERGGPITVTHPDIRRFFMTIPEASVLVINAAAYSQGGDILVLEMGTQYRVEDIANNLVRFYGYEPGKEIKIVYTGLRPGEKLFEELYYEKESLKKTANEKIYTLKTDRAVYDKEAINRFLKEDLPRFITYGPVRIREALGRVVKNYNYDGYNGYDKDNSKYIS
ncbi:MAG: polysaccharide biosynthesis protein [Spirochaetes bacterium]|nr:polysaccharide biosynthesis protein [Spirochaetota bacterium]